MKQIYLIISILFFCACGFAQNQNISGGLVFEGEPFLVVNPTNSNHLIAAWMGFTGGPGLSIKTKVSFNGGLSWSTMQALPHHSATFKSADPSLAFDNLGNVYACYIDYRESPDSGGVYVLKSTDGGLTWGSDSKAIDAYDDGLKKPIDRPWMSINPINNHIYITSKPPQWVSAPNRPYFIASLDAGLSWQAIRYLDTTGYLTGSLIPQPMAANTCNTSGEFLAVYPTYVPTQNVLPGFLLAKSMNDGASFNYKNVYFSTATGNDSLAKLGYRIIANPANPNHIVFVFLSKQHGDLDVIMIESLNGGNSWSSPLRVNDDAISNGKMQDLIWADFDMDGDLAIAWRDRRNAIGTGYSTDSDIWGAIRWKDSTHFEPNFKIADTLALYNATYLTQNGNDFMCIDLIKDTLNSIWGDVRNGVLNIYFSRKALRDGTTSIQLLSSEKWEELMLYPNPAHDKIYFTGPAIKSISIFSSEGKLLDKIEPIDVSFSILKYPKGLLYLEIETEEGIISKSIYKH